METERKTDRQRERNGRNYERVEREGRNGCAANGLTIRELGVGS